MTAVALDPKLDSLKKQIEAAFAGGPGPNGKDYAPSTTVHDATAMASAMLSAYHVATTVNPSKAFKAKAFAPQVQVSDPSELQDKAWWDTVLDIVQTAGPIVINALSKDYKPTSPNLATIIQALPEERRNDKDFVDYATTLLLSLGQATVQALSGQKDFTDPATQISIPEPPPGKPKGWFDDVCDFVSDAASVVVPIAMAVL
jgi:hypothetical protein